MVAMAAVSSSTTKPNTQTLSFLFSSFHFHRRLLPLSLSLPPTLRRRSLRCSAAKSPTGPVEKKKKKPNSATSSTTRRRKPKRRDGDGDGSEEGVTFSEVEIVQSPLRRRSRHEDDDDEDDDDDDGEESSTAAPSRNLGYYAAPMPNPPAGFVVDEHGRVLMASNKRIATIVDPTNNLPLECTIRRIFKSSRGDDCMLLCPVDTPVQMLKSTNIEGWSAVSDDEAEAILPTAAFALAKIHMHLVHSGFCYTARGGFCYTEDDIFDFRTDDGQDVEGLPTEGVEITSFHVDGAHYMIYTPADPLLFVAVKDENGMLHIADDDLLDDSAVISAIDEETEFNALVEEEAALLDTLMGRE